ncbi:S-adenosyl-L-methionine-dependent methyltransferase [Syncephalastrum racemosum]|uniref:S-adenosyl-L-methionine-dependent methyltransferase n=1 Tax=Syncephalastrum racemosum TaxID=13706 RepID=A0A1X2H276_SYNRA|nr:S-adenosyl-L-methionine-dependent methyltransferase [Syncephalastrum racemosum]
MSQEEETRFLQVFGDADHAAQDASEANPFPAYLDDEEDASLAPFCPTSAVRVLKALRMANVNSTDRVLDLGSGDGRFCTAAKAAFGVQRALGVESDPTLVERSHQLAEQVTRNAPEFVQGDLLGLPELVKEDWSVVVLFLLPDHTDKLADLLLYHHARGARIVSLVFNLSEIDSLHLIDSDDQDGIFVYAKE